MPTDNPAHKNQLYHDFRGQWQTNLDFAEMSHKTLRDGVYLDKWGEKSSEASGQYNLRKLMSMLLDLAPDMISIRVEELWQTPPTRNFEQSSYKTQIQEFINNVDGGGTHMDTLMRRVTEKAYINGVDVLVDQGAIAAEPLTRADENTHAFTSVLGPLRRYDWATDHAGRYKWVRYYLGESQPDDEGGTGGGVDRYLTYTRDSWILYSEDYDNGETETQEGNHTMGIVPVVQVYLGHSIHDDNHAIATSLMSELSPISRYMLNLTSQGQLDLFLSVAFFVATGVTPEQLGGEMGAALTKILPSPESDFKPVFSSVEHIAEKRAWLELASQQMLRKGKVLGLAGSTEGRARSGVQVAIESSPLHSELMSTANLLETSDIEIVRLAVSRVVGKPISVDDLGYAVEYNKVFTLQSAMTLIEELKAFSEVQGASEIPSVTRLMIKRVVDSLVRQGSDEHKAITREIKAFTGDSVDVDLVPPTDEDLE